MDTIIVKPIITEKAMNSVDSRKYTFAVSKKANKSAIKSAIKHSFNVSVISVSTSVMKGKTKVTGTRRVEKPESEWKKATVRLKKGEKISLFESGTDEKDK